MALQAELLFSDTYSGPRWHYGLTYRPAFMAVPDGRIIGADQPNRAFRFGTISYPRQLTERECAAYELCPVESVE